MIHNGWAFKPNENEKGKENEKEYKRLKEKYRIFKLESHSSAYSTPKYNPDDYDLIYTRYAKYHHAEYVVNKKPKDITDLELMLIFDEGNLCFGGSKEWENKYYVSED